MSLFTPNYYSKSIYTVPIDFYIKNNFKVIFCDLDNTLEAFYNEEPSDRAKELLDQLRRHNIKLFVISNNRESRVKKYAEMLGVEYHHSSKKPFGFKLRKYIKRNNLNRNEIIMVGDQILTDVIASKNVKVKAAGGIASFDDAQEFIRLGADRLGTSRLVKIMKKTDTGMGY